MARIQGDGSLVEKGLLKYEYYRDALLFHKEAVYSTMTLEI